MPSFHPSHHSPCYFLVPNLRAMDTTAVEMDPDQHVWIQPTIIDDNDLTFGGKALSAWYEEERRRLSSSSSSSSSLSESSAASIASALSEDDRDDCHTRGRSRFRRDLSQLHKHA